LLDDAGFRESIGPNDLPCRARRPLKSDVSQGADQLRQTLGENVLRLRKERCLTQRALADLAGVSSQYIGLVEAGIANPRSTTLDRLATALGVSVVALLFDATQG
jgi:DNA-binding XRE family transcriptional regulator